MNNEPTIIEQVGPVLASVFAERGFEKLTPVQSAVLSALPDEQDLRISSQTGSGKTVALGLALRTLVEERKPEDQRPKALVIAPTRELARQVERELTWLFAPFQARVTSLIGGASHRDECRALATRPAVIVGTPGRLLDHIENGTLDLSGLGAVVLDEADQMLDLGFREALDAILARTPSERRTHLVSATFANEVLRLADRVQTNSFHVEGTRLGVANEDIEHVGHLVEPRQRFDAIVNLLLAHDRDKAVLFVRTRAAVARLAAELTEAGFAVAPLSGEMEQRERERALLAFQRGMVRVLVATDVAARGIDVPDVTLVVHVDAPSDADAYTHRSGRTGRAGRKGTSALILTPHDLGGARRVLGRAGIRLRIDPLPQPEEIQKSRDERFMEELSAEVEVDPRAQALAKELMGRDDLEQTLTTLVMQSARFREPQPRDITPMRERERRQAPPRDRESSGSREWSLFHVGWGQRQGADPRRVLAMICRRGRVASEEVGGIRIGPNASQVQIAAEAAARFAEAIRRRDPRDPQVVIRPDRGESRPEMRN